MSIVYILTNESMPEIIKIGISENLELRIKQLDNTSMPLPFECFYAVEVTDALAIERKIHQGLDDYRIRSNREFFNVSPDKAKSLLKIAEIMGGTDVTPIGDIVETEQDKQALDRARKARSRFNFGMIGIQPGTVLSFKKDNTITCEVIDETQVMFRGEAMSLSGSASLIIQELGYDWQAVHGASFWCYGDKSLHDLRLESE